MIDIIVIDGYDYSYDLVVFVLVFYYLLFMVVCKVIVEVIWVGKCFLIIDFKW